jgi:hypothetical protein
MRALNWGVNRRFFKVSRLGTTTAEIGGCISFHAGHYRASQHHRQDGFTVRLHSILARGELTQCKELRFSEIRR